MAIATETMTLWHRVRIDADHVEWERRTLSGVRVEHAGGSRAGAPGPSPSDALVAYVFADADIAPRDRVEPGRPHGMECDLTLYFPREFDMDVRNAVVTVRGEDYRVVGDPERYTDAALPLGCSWNLVVRVVRYDV